MAAHPGYWLSQTRLNTTQNILSGIELFTIPDLEEVDPDPLDPLDVMVCVHFFAGSYSLWVAAVEWETGTFLAYSRNLALGPSGCWEECSHEVLRGVRIPLVVDGNRILVGLERDTRFSPKLLRDALGAEING